MFAVGRASLANERLVATENPSNPTSASTATTALAQSVRGVIAP